MNIRQGTLFTLSILLSACGQGDRQGETADDFAARVNGASPAPSPSGQSSAKVAAVTTEQGTPSAQTPSLPENGIQPDSSACNGGKVAAFFGKAADDATRAAIMAAVAPNTNVRFLKPGSGLAPDPQSTRLNVMLDVTGVVRDARCG